MLKKSQLMLKKELNYANSRTKKGFILDIGDYTPKGVI